MEVWDAGPPEYGMLVDFELIKRAQHGDDAAFNEIVLAYRKRILGTIARLIARPEDVEDVGQEVFLRLYFSLDQLRTAEVFEPWLYRLTVNAAYDYLRKQRRRMESRMSDLSEQQVMMADAVAGGKDDQARQERKQVREMRGRAAGGGFRSGPPAADAERSGRAFVEGA